MWNSMTWPEIDQLDRESTVLILPVGSTEQHGERLTVGTDHFCAEIWANIVSMKVSGSILLPTLYYGMSWHHTGFPGTISISKEVYTLLIRDLLGSLTQHGFKKILIINGHGGNESGINQAIAEIGEVYPKTKILNPVMTLMMKHQDIVEKTFEEGPVHAGAFEVSVMLAGPFEKTDVRDESVVTVRPKDAQFGQGTGSPEEWKQLFPRGQKGDQTRTDPDFARRLIQYVIGKLVELARNM